MIRVRLFFAAITMGIRVMQGHPKVTGDGHKKLERDLASSGQLVSDLLECGLEDERDEESQDDLLDVDLSHDSKIAHLLRTR